MKQPREASTGKSVILFISRTILTILVTAVIAGKPVLAYCDQTEQGEKFIVHYSAEKKSKVESDQGKAKMPPSLPAQEESSEVYSFESKNAVRDAAKTRVKDLYPEKEGWIKHKIKIEPY